MVFTFRGKGQTPKRGFTKNFTKVSKPLQDQLDCTDMSDAMHSAFFSKGVNDWLQRLCSKPSLATSCT